MDNLSEPATVMKGEKATRRRALAGEVRIDVPATVVKDVKAMPPDTFPA